HTQHAFLPLIQIADVAGAYGVTFLVAAANAWIFELLFRQEWFRQFFDLGFQFSVFGFQTGKTTVLSENRKPQTENPPYWVAFQGLAVFLAIVAALFYGFWRLDQEDFLPGPRVALLQGNLDQRLRNRADQNDGGDARESIADHYVALCKIALEQQQPKPDLLVWPETSFPFRWIDVSPKLAPEKVPENWIE